MNMDSYRRKWELPVEELCDTCGQPDSTGDCNHERLSDAEAHALGAIKPEYILCACILVACGDRGYRRYSNYYPPYGLMFCGLRHGDCMTNVLAWAAELDDHFDVELHSAQGFLTSHGRFVDRKEGAKIAYRQGQINEPKPTLFSEDLY